MAKDKKRSIPVLSTLVKLMAIPCNFLGGLMTGLIAPVAAMVAIVAGVRLMTGKFPFLAHVEAGEDGERQLTLKLVPPDQVKGLWAEHKQTFGGQLSRLKTEMQAISEQARAKAK